MDIFSTTHQGTSEVFVQWKTSTEGLSHVQVRERATHSRVKSTFHVAWIEILVRQCRSIFVYLLFFAAGVALLLGEAIDTLLIFFFIAINVTFGFFQEYRSEKTVRMLERYVHPRARVRREGREFVIDGNDLVEGDIVLIETGDVVPADIRLASAQNLVVDESSITGESEPIYKQSERLSARASEAHMATNCVFCGTQVVGGIGEGVVIARGEATVVGAVSRLTRETRKVGVLEQSLHRLSVFIFRTTAITIAVGFLIHLLLKGSDIAVAELAVFFIALAVSVIPEGLLVVMTFSLSTCAMRLARQHVIVKRLSSVEDLGSIEVLCTDKTGTLTENRLRVSRVAPSDEHATLLAAAYASSFLNEDESEPNNAFDRAVWHRLTREEKEKVREGKRSSEIPFSPNRKRNSVLIKHACNCEIIIRGAPETILSLCDTLDVAERRSIEEDIRKEGLKGHRVLGVAARAVSQVSYTEQDEEHAVWKGYISFVDPLKASTRGAVEHARRVGVRVKIITGDSPEVAGAVAHAIGLILDPQTVLTGTQLEALSPERQRSAVSEYAVFARMTPLQKHLAISLLQERFEVGYLGEGINDAPALKKAHVGIVVNDAADIARSAADIVLLEKGLDVIVNGILEGRRAFSHTMTYIRATLASNFGNFYAVLIASFLIPVLPMLPIQILLVNLLSDVPMLSIATDTVDTSELARPRAYHMRDIGFIAIMLGLISTLYDFVFFGIFFHAEPEVLRTNWFIGSILTELAFLFSIRTLKPFLFAPAPSRMIISLTGLAVAVTFLLPFVPSTREMFKFSTPSFESLVVIITVVCLYFITTEIVKLLYVRHLNGARTVA